jgi:nucleotide-binding universal stress UspA family protein
MSPKLETILLATDGLPASEPASEQAIDLALQLSAHLLIVSVLVSGRQPT